MRKLGVFILGASLSFAFAVVGIFDGKTDLISAAAKEEKIVYIGGMSAGFTLKTGGAQIIGLSEVRTENGTKFPASEAGIRMGDKIVKVAGVKINSILELNEIINKTKEKEIELEVLRGGETLKIAIKPAKDKSTEKYKIGVLVRDNVSGIGTITYIEKETGKFGALGHSVMGDEQNEMKISNGNVFECNIIGVNKGVRGKAGELRGMFLTDKTFGIAEKLCNCGIFGIIHEDFNENQLLQTVATSDNAKPGEAYIYSTVDGVCPQKYEIEIVKVDRYNKENKDYVIKITDPKLIDLTGGIVQGMSGSPIIQDGKLVGAVTHVFLNDPTRGYGINIETMLKEN